MKYRSNECVAITLNKSMVLVNCFADASTSRWAHIFKEKIFTETKLYECLTWESSILSILPCNESLYKFQQWVIDDNYVNL